ncbi:putative 2OG-Fe(II) oxygenase [Candidatus Pelagibacter sp.]|uniref:putative 2OG-Fe(II) oxygenase n=1 Tax=Candidatus Pelagibacter sp. TaxID=2024849 RepID=UPI003D0DE795
MKVHNFFPLSILQDQINLTDEEKTILINDIRVMEQNSQNSNYKIKQASWTGDTQGYEYIYNNPNFDKLFSEIKKKIDNYLDFLKIDKDQIEIYIQRSWATISKNDEVISKHQHLQSHLSFAYYLQKNQKDSNFVIYDDEKKNEFIPGLFGSKTLFQKKLIKEISFSTATRITLNVNENDIIIFPSKTSHSTEQIKFNNERISISGDVVFLAKNSNLIEHLTPNFNNWKKL